MRIFRSIDLLWATLSMLALGSWSGLACTDLKPLDKSPGSYAWVYHTDQPIATSPVVDTDGVIYVVSGSTLHAVYDDGSPAWQFAAAAGLLVSPAVVAEPEKLVAVIDSAGTLYALDADGTTLFSKSLGGAVTRIPPVVTSTQILALTDSGTLVAYDHGGTKKLDQPAGGTPIGPPVVGADGTIYVSSITELRALKPDGSTRWSVGRTAHGSVAIDPQSGTIYAVLDSDLYSVDPQTGQETLRFTIPGTAGDFTPLLAGDLIYVVDGTKLLAINKTSWQLDGSYSASEGLLDCIRFPKQTGRIYVHGEHVMVGLNADLSEAWKLTGLDINGSCAAFGDAPNRLYVGTLQKQLYAINLLAAP